MITATDRLQALPHLVGRPGDRESADEVVLQALGERRTGLAVALLLAADDRLAVRREALECRDAPADQLVGGVAIWIYSDIEIRADNDA